ncbi:hypothetical protein PPMP20_26820 [Paraburkholderia phymatum]|uniref:Uncharacterized protein n=1 Tax=Paraburkholderia phymatum (strain DSM 17167 / CIP 108236 / LMG 21445 / STM815) TaxID=391038 RepID=B2JL00_PARP8|nr:hypothetical protein [Paraburkholderia phymatum]ACC72529.1 hypothetical protein Bphy_3375 [Paraburkholderia phymatum STM815]
MPKAPDYLIALTAETDKGEAHTALTGQELNAVLKLLTRVAFANEEAPADPFERACMITAVRKLQRMIIDVL